MLVIDSVVGNHIVQTLGFSLFDILLLNAIVRQNSGVEMAAVFVPTIIFFVARFVARFGCRSLILTIALALTLVLSRVCRGMLLRILGGKRITTHCLVLAAASAEILVFHHGRRVSLLNIWFLF